MRPPRVSLVGLIPIVVAYGVGFAALRSPSQLWASTLFSLALGTLTISVVAALISRERKQAFWSGWPSTRDDRPARHPVCPGGLCPLMGTTIVFGGYPGMGTQLPAPKSQWSVWTEPDRTNGVGRQIVLVSPEPFRRIGHSLICLVGAAEGGSLARRFYDRRSDRRSEAAVKAAGLMLKVLEAGL